MTDPTRPRPLGPSEFPARELARDTAAAAVREAASHTSVALDLLADGVDLPEDVDDGLLAIHAAQVHATLAHAAETRALRLMLTDQLRALGRRP